MLWKPESGPSAWNWARLWRHMHGFYNTIDGPWGDAKFNSRQITLFWETPNFIAAKFVDLQYALIYDSLEI